MNWPCVSAIINTYKRPKLLDRALASVLESTFTDYEVLVIHDGPADEETVKVCEIYSTAFEGKNISFTFLSLDENSGYQCVPKNVGIWHAKGDYIAFLDDDNAWTPDHLQVLVDAIEEGTVWPDFTYGRRLYVDERPKGSKPDLYTGNSPFVPFNEEAKKRLSTSPTHNFIDTSDALVSKGAYWRLHLATSRMWNEELRRFGDWELFTRGVFFAGWRGKAVDKIVQTYYWHGENVQLTRDAKETPQQKVLK